MIREAERGRAGLWLPVCLGFGTALYFALTVEPPFWLGFALAGPVGLGCWFARSWPGALVPLFAVAAMATGFAAAQLATHRAPPLEPLPARAMFVEGTVRAIEFLPDGAQRVILAQPRLNPDTPPLRRDLRIRLRADDPARAEVGMVLRVRALLRPPGLPAYPGAWDLQRDAFFTRMAGGGRALNPAEILAPAPPAGLSGWLEVTRAAIARRFTIGMGGAAGAVSATLFTGLTAAIPLADRAAFRDSGLAHLLAVAGLHIGIVMGLFFGLTRLLLTCSEHAALHWPCKQIAAGVAVLAGGLYMLLTGMHVPIMRSFAMACLFTLAVIAGRRAFTIRGLGLAAIVILLLAPHEITGVSFQMSFSAVLALIAGYAVLRPALTRLRGEGGLWGSLRVHAAMLALTSLLAGVASAPYGAYHFGHVQAYFVLSNLLAVPLTAMWVMPWGLVAIALMPIGLEFLALWPMAFGTEAILWIARATTALPASTIAIPAMPFWGLITFSLGLGWLCIWRARWRLLGIAAMALGLASPWLAHPADIFVSADARLVGVRAGRDIFVQAGAGATPFTLDAWVQHWAGDVEDRRLPAAVPGVLGCDGPLCRLGPAGQVLLLRQGESVPPEACAGALLVIAVEPLRKPCPDIGFIDRFTVWREGAHAVWIYPDHVRVLSDRRDRGWRPWVEIPPRRRPELPPAMTE